MSFMSEDILHTINLEMGDISGDGHKISQFVTIKSNLDYGEVKRCYQLGVEKLGFDPVEHCCSEYEESSITGDKAQKLYECGFIEEYDPKTKSYSFWTESWANLYLFVCKLGWPYFYYEIETEESSIDIGGYGLYYG